MAGLLVTRLCQARNSWTAEMISSTALMNFRGFSNSIATNCQLPVAPQSRHCTGIVLATVLLVLAEMTLTLFGIGMVFLDMTLVVPAAEVRCCPDLAILCFLTKLVDQHSILLAFPCFSQIACHILASSIDSNRSTREIWAEYYIKKTT